MFSFITMNWRAKPLVSLETIVNLISSTKTSTGLEIDARLDEGAYPDKIRVSDDEFDTINLHGDAIHPEWNRDGVAARKHLRGRPPARS